MKPILKFLMKSSGAGTVFYSVPVPFVLLTVVLTSGHAMANSQESYLTTQKPWTEYQHSLSEVTLWHLDVALL